MVSSMNKGLVCVAGGGSAVLNFQTLNCLQFKPKLFSFPFILDPVSPTLMCYLLSSHIGHDSDSILNLH